MRRSIKIGVAAAVALLLVGGVAIAAWLASGSGTGSAKAGSLVALQVNRDTAVADLYPGTLNGAVYVKVDNPNTFPVTVTSVTIPAGTIDAVCGVSVNASGIGFEFAGQPTLAAGAVGVPIKVTNALTMSSSSATGCQGKDFSIPGVTVTGQVGS